MRISLIIMGTLFILGALTVSPPEAEAGLWARVTGRSPSVVVRRGNNLVHVDGRGKERRVTQSEARKLSRVSQSANGKLIDKKTGHAVTEREAAKLASGYRRGSRGWYDDKGSRVTRDTSFNGVAATLGK